MSKHNTRGLRIFRFWLRNSLTGGNLQGDLVVLEMPSILLRHPKNAPL